MKTFKDLVFNNHPAGDGKQAVMLFPNGYGVSIVRFNLPGGFGYGSYTSDESEWELAVLKETEDEWSLTYETPITDDVLGHLSEDDVTEIMAKVQSLK
jgi:hypothetical protein